MAAIEGIEPFLHIPDQPLRVDARRDAARRRQTSEQLVGLADLLGDPSLPPGAFAAIQEGTWAPTGQRGIYLVREHFKTSGSIEKTRWCVVAGYEPSSGCFRPIVTSDRDVVDRGCEELRRAGVDPVGAVALYRDEEHRIDRLVEARGDIAPFAAYSNDDVEIQVWCLSDEESHMVGTLLENLGGAIVGDIGMYRALVRSRDHAMVSPESRPTLRFYNQRDFGVAFEGMARAYQGLGPVDPNRVTATLREVGYDVSEIPIPTVDAERQEVCKAVIEKLRNEGVTKRATMIALPGVDTAFLIVSPLGGVKLVDHENPPEVAADFDVEWIEKGILRRILDIETSPVPAVFESERFFDLRDAPDTSLVFLVNPPPKRLLVSLAAHDWRLPVESLQLTPAAARGLLLVPLKPSTETLHIRDQLDVDA